MILPLFVLLAASLSMANEVDVIPLVEEWRLDKTVSTYTIVTYSTLIQDGTHTVVVDVPPANETASIAKMIDAIKGKDLQPEDIQKLVITSGHPKDFGHNSVFPQAHQYFSTYEHNGKTFLRTGLYENGKMQLTPNVQLWYTPGHSAEDITVVVSKVKNRGIVAITGNLILNSSDVLHPEFWESKAQHVQAGIKRRRKVICHADYVIPGHGPIFQVTDQHREAVKCQNKGENGAEDSQAEQQRRRRQHDQERHQQQAVEHQRHEQLRRERQAEYQQKLAHWNWEQSHQSSYRTQQDQAQHARIGEGASVAGGYQVGQGASVDGGYQVGQGASVSGAYQVGEGASVAGETVRRTEWAGCCQQQPCHNGQKLCKEECCVQPPCKVHVPPCKFETTCCTQQETCAWNQVRCYQQDCSSQQNCGYQITQRCEETVNCGSSKQEIHHHYIGNSEEVFHTQIRKDQLDLVTTLNDQQKQIREDQDKVNHILLDHINDNYREFKNYVEKETQHRIDFNNLVTRNIQALINLLQQQQQLLQHEQQKQMPVLSSAEHQLSKVTRRLDEHKQATDQWWTHQKSVQDTKRAQEENTFKRIVRPAYNFTRTVSEQPQPQPQPQPCRTTCATEYRGGEECRQSCGQSCSSSSSSGCVQKCSGCAQSSNGGCSGCGSSGGCNQAGCSGSRQHRHAPGQRHIGRRRLRRQEANEKKKMVELQQLLTTEEKRENANDDD